MKNFIKIVLIALQVLVLVACTRGGGSSSGRAAPASDFTYDLTSDGKGVVIREYTGNGGALVIPAEIEGYPVMELNARAIYGEDSRSYGPGYNITSVVIPASVKKIGTGCFVRIENLKSVTIHGIGVEVHDAAFKDCLNLETLNIPNGDNTLIPGAPSIYIRGRGYDGGDDAFQGCKKLPLAMRSRLVGMGFTEP